ncbi:MAG: 6-carboxytetrahydropterin synthase QueD [Gammaproteobacteria bacterium]|nr:6-carboxytetrahydropterin synthase QueD [Gammaproteobacteria bacterium]
MAKYTVNQICYFSAAHILRDYPEACERLHGHNYKVIIEVSANQLDHLGMVLDYVVIQNIANKYISIIDHQFLNNIPPFDKTLNPTAENVAAWLYQKMATDINNNRVTLESITIWETDHNYVKYQPN